MDEGDQLLVEALKHLEEHNREYQHRTPRALIEQIRAHLRQPKQHTAIWKLPRDLEAGDKLVVQYEGRPQLWEVEVVTTAFTSVDRNLGWEQEMDYARFKGREGGLRLCSWIRVPVAGGEPQVSVRPKRVHSERGSVEALQVAADALEDAGLGALSTLVRHSSAKSIAAVWVVEGETGEYADEGKWQLLAYLTKEDADAHAARALMRSQELYAEADAVDSYPSRESCLKNEWDPGMRADYNGTQYRCYRIPIAVSLDDGKALMDEWTEERDARNEARRKVVER
jgi:hypothetical protein